MVELAKLLKKEIKVPINLGKLESVVSVECCPSLLFFLDKVLLLHRHDQLTRQHFFRNSFWDYNGHRANMTQQCQAIAKKTNILVRCINRSTVSEPHGEILSLFSIRPQLDCLFPFLDSGRLSPFLVLLEGVQKARRMTSALENVTYKERWRIV